MSVDMKNVLLLTKVATFGAVVVGGTTYMNKISTDRKIRKTKTYQNVLGMLYDHEKAVNYLGKPIKEGKLSIDSIDDNNKKISVDVNGSNTKGKLDCVYSLSPDSKIEINRVEIKFSDIPNKIFVIHEI